MSKLLTVLGVARDTKVLNASKPKFLYYFFLTRYMNFFLRNLPPYGKVLKSIFSTYPHPDFEIQNSIGKWSVVPFNDTMTISAPYFEAQFMNWPDRAEKRRIFLDIGANIGRYTLLAANKFNYSKILAIEANPYTYSLLKKNISLNGIENKVIAEQVAVGNKEGEVIIQADTHHLGGANVLQNNESSDKDKTKASVHLTTVDTLFSKTGLDPKEVDFIKIDVEGMEGDVLEGMTNVLSNMQKGALIMIEIIDTERALGILTKQNFERIETEATDNLFIKK